MKLRINGNAVAIAIAGLALALAAGGTAYAVGATTVNIADRAVPSRVAKVAPAGYLYVVNRPSLIDATAYLFSNSGASPVTSPTSAVLALTAINYDNSGNRQYPNTDYRANSYAGAGTPGVSQPQPLGFRRIRH